MLGKNADLSVSQVPIIMEYRSVNLFSLRVKVNVKVGWFYSYMNQLLMQCFGQNAAVEPLFAPVLAKNLPLDCRSFSL